MAEEKRQHYPNESRGYKTKGYVYKDRYIHDKMCPECGGTSVYKDEWATRFSYKCMRRSCRHQWFEDKIFPKKDVLPEILQSEDTTKEEEPNSETI